MNRPSAILLGSKPGSIVALSTLLERGWNVLGVIAPQHHEREWVQGPSLREFALGQGLTVMQSPAQLGNEQVDFLISYMYRNLVRSETRSLARRAAVNFHPAPLPEFGGWAFYNLAIIEQAREYGCSCHVMDDGFDSGPLVTVRRFLFDPQSATAWSLEMQTQQEMIRLFYDFCLMAENVSELRVVEQDKRRSRYLTREEFEALKEIPAGADEETIQRHARAFWYPPYECAFLRLGPHKVEVVPKIAREQIAPLLHLRDLATLQRVAEDCRLAAPL
jgi:methionyl-tRNA formyltransferase